MEDPFYFEIGTQDMEWKFLNIMEFGLSDGLRRIANITYAMFVANWFV